MKIKVFLGSLGVLLVAAALSTGAASAAGTTVAICATANEGANVRSVLVNTGLYSTVDDLDCTGGTPDLATLQSYDVVVAFPDSNYADFGTLSANLASFVDGGGRLVLEQWGFYSCCGDWWGTQLDTGGYLPFTGGHISYGGTGGALEPVLPGDPLLAGIASLSENDGSTAVTSLASGATLVANWENGQPAIAYKGNVIGINAWIAFDDSLQSKIGDTTAWTQMLVNAIGGGQVGGERAGYCAVAGNTTPAGAAIAPGTFLDLAAGQPASDSHYTGALTAYFYEGLGISCDALPGYTKTGEMVGSGGHGDPGGYVFMKKN